MIICSRTIVVSGDGPNTHQTILLFYHCNATVVVADSSLLVSEVTERTGEGKKGKGHNEQSVQILILIA